MSLTYLKNVSQGFSVSIASWLSLQGTAHFSLAQCCVMWLLLLLIKEIMFQTPMVFFFSQHQMYNHAQLKVHQIQQLSYSVPSGKLGQFYLFLPSTESSLSSDTNVDLLYTTCISISRCIKSPLTEWLTDRSRHCITSLCMDKAVFKPASRPWYKVQPWLLGLNYTS